MKITSIRLKNFRSFKDEVEIPLNDDLNVFVGENNVGKSNIATALKKLKMLSENDGNYHPRGGATQQQIFTQNDWNLDNIDQPMKINLKIKLDSFENKYLDNIVKKTFKANGLHENNISEMPEDIEIFFEHIYTQNLTLPIVKIWGIYFQGDRCALEPESFYNNKGSVVLDSYIAGEVSKTNTPIGILGLQKNLFMDALHSSESKTIILANGPKIYRSVLEVFTKKTKPFNEIRVLPYKPKTSAEESFDGSELAGVLLNLKNHDKGFLRDKYKLIQDYFGKNFPMLELEVVENNSHPEIKIIRKHNKHEHALHQAGTGIFEFLVQLVSLVEAKDSLFIFEEPELHLHPSAQKLLFNIIQESSKTNQIIIITHSIYFLDIKNIKNNIAVRNSHGQTNISTYSLVLSPQDASKIHKELSYKNRELFFSKVTLLVEGATEYAAFHELASKLDLCTESNNIFICSAEGCNTLATYTNILDAFKFPYVLVADKDAENLDSVKNAKRKIILDPDFEGVLINAGFQTMLDEARRTHSHSKPRQGEYIAEQLTVAQIPQPYKDVITQLREIIKGDE